MYTKNVALHFEVVWFDFHRCNWRFQKGVGWVRGAGNLHRVVWKVWFVAYWAGGGGSAGGVGISSGVGGHEDPFHHIRMEVFWCHTSLRRKHGNRKIFCAALCYSQVPSLNKHGIHSFQKLCFKYLLPPRLFVFHNSQHCAKIPCRYYVEFIIILQEQREREKQDLELAKEMAEDDDDFP